MKKQMNNKLIDYCSISIITPKETIENDKMRIKRKFNFKNAQLSEPSTQAKLKTKSKTKANTSFSIQTSISPIQLCPTNHKLTIHKQSDNNHKPKNSILTHSCTGSSNTQIEDREQLNQVMRNKKLFFTNDEYDDADGDISGDHGDANRSLPNDNKENSNKDDEDLDYSRYNNYLTQDDNKIEAMLEGHSFKTKKTQTFLSTPNAKKILKLFHIENQSEVEANSIRLLNNNAELINKLKPLDPSPQYKFISEVKHINATIPLLPIRKINTLHPTSLVVIISFIFEDFESLIASATWFKRKVLYSLSTVYDSLISKFKSQYKALVDIEEYYFEARRITKERMSYPLFDLVIKARIIHNPSSNMSYILRYSYKDKEIGNDDEEEYTQFYVIDIRKERTYPLWFTHESEVYNDKKMWYTYSQHIHSVCYGDSVLLRVNVLSKGNNNGSKGNRRSFSWLPLVIGNSSALPAWVYEKKERATEVVFDKMRHSEIEKMVRLWKGEGEIPEAYWPMKENFKKMYLKLFKGIKFYYDNSKPHLFKITMEAQTIGSIPKNPLLQASIEIVEESSPIELECCCIGLLSVQQAGQRYQIRKGTKVILYIIDA